MRTQIALISSLAALSALLPVAAFAQDAVTPPPGAAGDPPPAPAAAAAVAPPPPASPDEAPAAAAEPPAAEAGPESLPGWVRIDSDAGGVQLWGGGTFPLTDSVGLAFDMYVFQTSQSLGEFDLGPAITAGPFIVTPMIGVQFDWTERRAQALVPQLYVTGGPSPIYSELWLQYYANSVFVDDASNQLYGRLIVDYKFSDYIAAGVEIDLGFDSKASDEGKGEIVSLPVGVNVLFSNVGAASSFMGFLGYETKDGYGSPSNPLDPMAGPANNHVAGRLTFVHNF